MNEKQASLFFEALSSDVRLKIFLLLVRFSPNGLVQGEIAQKLDLPITNLSFHLKALVHSTLVTVQREGRFMRYKANTALMWEVVGYLSSECCTGCRTIDSDTANQS